MSDDPFAQPKTLKEARRTIPSRDEVQTRLLACQGASDYEAALVCVSLIDHLFMQAISCKFVPLSSDRLSSIFLDGGNAPLSSFSSKIKLMHALGVFGNNTRIQCERVNNIRNHFAHHKDQVSFDDVVVQSECGKFSDAKIYMQTLTPISDLTSPKMKFVSTCLCIAILTLAHLDLVKQGVTPQSSIEAF